MTTDNTDVTDDAPKPERNYPANADILMAAREDSKRYYFKTPESGGTSSIPATSVEMAQKLLADGTHTAPEDWVQIPEEELSDGE